MRPKVSKMALLVLLLGSIGSVAASIGSSVRSVSVSLQNHPTVAKTNDSFNIELLEGVSTDDKDDYFDAFQEPFNVGVVGFDTSLMNDLNLEDKSHDLEGFDTTVPTPNVPAQKPPTENCSIQSSPIKASLVRGPTRTGGSGALSPTKDIPVESQPALSELVSEEKTPALIGEICRSREFQPTLENYWVSGADEWLRSYTVENRDGPLFGFRGLVGSIAERYLGCGDFYRGGKGSFPVSSCEIRCLDVVQKVDDIQEARRVYFVLTSTAGLAERVRAIYNAMEDVPRSVAKLVNGMPSEGWQDTPPEEASNILFETINTAMLAASPSVPAKKISEDGYYALEVAKYYYDQAVQASDQASKGNDPFKYDKAFDSKYEPSLADLGFTSKGYANSTQKVPEGMPKGSRLGKAVSRYRSMLEDTRNFAVALEDGSFDTGRAESFEAFKRVFEVGPGPPRRRQWNVATGIENMLKDAVVRGRSSLLDMLVALLHDDFSSTGGIGTTHLSTILRHGHHLPCGSERSMSEFANIPIGNKIARDVFLRLFNNSLRAQPIYISCTRNSDARSCSSDRSGPQDLKACVPGGYVCYMYEWKDRSPRNRSRNKKPIGHETWSENPWNIEVQDIITGSFNKHMQNESIKTLPVLAALGEPKTAQHFNVPVCVSDYNWNTQLTGWNTLCDTDINCPAKSLPCNCGVWGKDTLSVWKDIGLMDSPNHKYLSATVCPRQIRKKITDPLERYVAYCNLDIRRGSSSSRVDGARRYQGRDRYCDFIVATLESMPKNPETQETPRSAQLDVLNPALKLAFICHIKKGGRGCQMYDKMFDDLWKNWQASNAAANATLDG